MKITRTTIKSFIKKNKENLYVKVKSTFDSMVDCVMSTKGEFHKITETTDHLEYTLGIKEAWFVGESRDYFDPYEDSNFKGYEIYNCCGTFILAVKK